MCIRDSVYAAAVIIVLRFVTCDNAAVQVQLCIYTAQIDPAAGYTRIAAGDLAGGSG